MSLHFIIPYCALAPTQHPHSYPLLPSFLFSFVPSLTISFSSSLSLTQFSTFPPFLRHSVPLLLNHSVCFSVTPSLSSFLPQIFPSLFHLLPILHISAPLLDSYSHSSLLTSLFIPSFLPPVRTTNPYPLYPLLRELTLVELPSV